MNVKPLIVALSVALCPSVSLAQSSGTGTATHTLRNERAIVVPPRQGFTIGMRPGPDNAYGYPFVESLVEGSNAEAAGLMVGDTILSSNGRDARTPPLFPVREAGTRYLLRVRRGREELELLFVYPDAPRRKPPPPADSTATAARQE